MQSIILHVLIVTTDLTEPFTISSKVNNSLQLLPVGAESSLLTRFTEVLKYCKLSTSLNDVLSRNGFVQRDKLEEWSGGNWPCH